MPEKTIVLTKINLVGTLFYFHQGTGASAILQELEESELEEVERLWVQLLRAMWLLRSEESETAANIFKTIFHEMLSLGHHNQAHFILLFETLSLLESGQADRASEKAVTAAIFFSSSQFYGGVAAKAANNLLLTTQRKALHRQVISELIDVVLSPAKQRLDGAS